MLTSSLLDRLLAVSSAFLVIETDEDGAIRSGNEAFGRAVGADVESLEGRPITEFLTTADATRVRGWIEGGAVPVEPVRLNLTRTNAVPLTVRCVLERGDGVVRILGEREVDDDAPAAEQLFRLNNELATLARERGRRKRELERTRRELEEALDELRTSYWHLQKIQEVLPVCMGCGKVKTDAARWQSVADYLKDNEIFLSHGYCPTCVDGVFAEFGLSE